MEKEILNIFEEGVKKYCVNINKEQTEKFVLYAELLKEWNKKFNLTAIEEDRDVVIKHFIDSVSIIPYIKECNTLIDIGTGAGFPGIPIKIIRDDINVTLVDSSEKKVTFLNEVILRLELKGICAVCGRAEDMAQNLLYREKFDIVVARAVAKLPVLLEYCLAFVKMNGIFIAMKGDAAKEIEESKKALDVLGGKIEEINKIILTQSDMKRSIITIRKCSNTPKKYPRKAGKIKKEPIN